MFLLNAQNNFDILLSLYIEGHMIKKDASLNLMSLVGFQASKIWIFFGKFTVEQVLKSFSDRNNTKKSPVFGFCDRPPYDLEKPKE